VLAHDFERAHVENRERALPGIGDESSRPIGREHHPPRLPADHHPRFGFPLEEIYDVHLVRGAM
jgi:hypothetical protein